MFTYVNTVLVSNNASAVVNAEDAVAVMAGATTKAAIAAQKGQYILQVLEGGTTYPATAPADKKFRVGVIVSGTIEHTDANGDVKYFPVVKWSNAMSKDAIETVAESTYAQKKEEKVEINFATVDATVGSALAEGGKRVVLRITYKDLPTRYRKWAEPYEIITAPAANASAAATAIADALKTKINKESKRARVVATAANGKLTLIAKPYADDNSVDSISPAENVRFSVNVYYTDPQATGFASKNKYSLTGVTVEKTPGEVSNGEAKLVRDREANSLGYQGILNHGEGTWPIIKPAMETDLTASYDTLTVQFRNDYKAADDIDRKTKELIEVYCVHSAGADPNATIAALKTAIGIA
jgi:hypothetical protein